MQLTIPTRLPGRRITRHSERSSTRLPAGAILVTGLALLLLASTPLPGRAQQIPQEFTNLQVLPKDITPRQLLQTMRGFAISLGVRCQFCHVGEEGMPLDQFDFSSDEKEHKKTARVMIQMLMTINNDFMSRVTGHSDEPAVTCMTCHRGKSEPEVDMNAIPPATAPVGAARPGTQRWQSGPRAGAAPGTQAGEAVDLYELDRLLRFFYENRIGG